MSQSYLKVAEVLTNISTLSVTDVVTILKWMSQSYLKVAEVLTQNPVRYKNLSEGRNPT